MKNDREQKIVTLCTLLHPLVQIPVENLLIYELFLAEHPFSSTSLEGNTQGKLCTLEFSVCYYIGRVVMHFFSHSHKTFTALKNPPCQVAQQQCTSVN